MDNREYDPNESWDEYRWERYLRENDCRCEQFATLLETHLHNPQRDRIIAREMGWHHLLGGNEPTDAYGRSSMFLELLDLMLTGDEQGEEAHSGNFLDGGPLPDGEMGFGAPSLFSEDDERMIPGGSIFDSGASAELDHPQLDGNYNHLPGDFTNGHDDDDDLELQLNDLDDDDDDEDDDEDELTSHPLCDLAATYQEWLERLVQDEPELLQNPIAARLAAYSAICQAKVCTALECDEYEDLGMTIAYLKRGLKAINTALEAYFELCVPGGLPATRADELRSRIFRIRDGIIELMGFYRMEWMRRIDE